ncbi:MAG: hypothetical protein AB7U98_07910 [Candidatus Nitrosocosmicus sp.]
MSFFCLATLALDLISREALVQASSNTTTKIEPLNVTVYVLNNGSTNFIGSIHVISDKTGVSMNANAITFLAGQTVMKVFQINQNEIPIGTGFSVEVVYGDDYSKRVYGVNDATNKPELFKIIIP